MKEGGLCRTCSDNRGFAKEMIWGGRNEGFGAPFLMNAGNGQVLINVLNPEETRGVANDL